MSNPFARALNDYHFDALRGPLRYRDGDKTEEHGVDGYFEAYDPDDPGWFSAFEGPLLDLGAGAGRHTLYFQDHLETTAIEPTEFLVEVLRDRGVADAREADMFALRDEFDRDRFRSVLCVGTHVGMAGSMAGLRRFLGDLAYVTTPDATVVFDGYDPERAGTRDLIGYREDPAEETAHRIVQYEYDGDLGEPWLFRLFTPAEIRAATVGTGWAIDDLRHPSGDWSHTYNVRLTKR